MPASTYLGYTPEGSLKSKKSDISKITTSSTSKRPKKVIVLSDSESDDNPVHGSSYSDTPDNSDNNRNRRSSFPIDSDGNSEDLDEEESRVIPWWKRRWSRSLLAEKESTWYLASHCRCRTQLYHTLLHYKLRLFLKIKDKLELCNGNVPSMMSDLGFVQIEFDRFTALLKHAGDKYGGGRDVEDSRGDLWADDGEETNATTTTTVGGSLRLDVKAGSISKQRNSSVISWLKNSNK